MATVVITGGGGFIGSHISDALLARGDRVLVLDLGRKPSPALADASGQSGFSYRRCDVTVRSSVRKALAARPDAVIHAAAGVGVESYMRSPMTTIESSVLGTHAVMREAIETRSRFVMLSTSEVFGRNPAVPWIETADRILGSPTTSRWSYSSSKGLCEHLVNAAHDELRLSTSIVRPFNVYGPRQRPSFVIPTTLHRALNRQRPIIYGDGSQTRCFTYVADLVDGILRVLDAEAASGETFNLGSSHEWAVRDAVRVVTDAVDSDLEPEFRDPREVFGPGFDEIARRVPDSSKAERVLGWRARTELPAGVAATVTWARGHPEWLRQS